RSGVWERILHLAVVVIAAVVGPATVRVAKRPLPRVCSLSRMVEGEGFEPSKAEPADLQSAPFDRSGTPPTKLAIVAIRQGLCKRGSPLQISRRACLRQPPADCK